MESNASYTLIGLFVVILSSALIAALLWLTTGVQKKSYDTYLVYVYESVAGLTPKAAVKYRGVDVGQVHSIQLDVEHPSRVILQLNIEQGTPIREDTVAKLATQGLTGLVTVELSGGSETAQPLTAQGDAPWPVIRSTPSLIKRLDDAFTGVLQDIDNLAAELDVLLSPTNQRALRTTLGHLATITGAFANQADNIGQTLENLKRVTAVFAEHGDELEQALLAAQQTLANSAHISAELAPLLTRISSGADAVQIMAETITATSKDLSRAVTASRKDLQRLAKRTTPELNALLAELGRLTHGVQRFVNELDRNPQMLILGRQPAQLGPGE